MFLGILIEVNSSLKQKLNQFINKHWKRGNGSTKILDSQVTNKILSYSLPDATLIQYARQYEGKLLLQNEYGLPSSLFKTFLNEQILSPVSPIKRTFLSAICQRCHNTKKHFFATIFCTHCQKNHLYCRHCLQMGRIMECTPLYYWTGPTVSWPKHQSPCTWQGKLTSIQQYAALRMKQAVQTNGQILTWAVTGSGKSEMLFPSITNALQMGKRICIASPRADVVRELLPRLKQAFASVSIQGLYGGSEDREGTGQLIISTTHQLLRFQRAFDLLVIDEVDAFPFHQDMTLQFAARRALKKQGSLIYLTATPRHKQRQEIANKKLDYVFVPIRFHRHLLPIPTFKNCFTLQKDLLNRTIPKQFIQWLQNRQVSDRQILIFLPTIELVQQLRAPMTTVLQNEHIITNKREVSSVHAEDDDREEKVIAFRQKKLQALLTTTILERGVTFPAIDVVVIDAGHRVFDDAALVQIAGRAGRSLEDPTGEVLFLHQGKSNSMVKAKTEIIQMNNRAKKWLRGDERL